MSFQCPACQRTFGESGFCPYDRSVLVAHSPAQLATQLSMAMPSQPQPPPSSPPGNKTNVEPRRTFPLTPGPHAVQTQEITHTVGKAPEPPKSSPMRAVSASENPQEVLEAFRQVRDNEYDRLVGQTLDGRYFVEKKIGEGGMGVVFAARHAVIERPLAIKVLKREVMRDTATIRRFVQEAKAASRIGHPNIVDVTDFGTTPDGMTYSVMEYVDGATLGQTIRVSAPFNIQRVMRIGAQIARALGAAHDKGIVHRDLKPENVFLVDRDGRVDFVKIVDFGIAKVAPIEGQEAGPRLTRAGSVFGTPEYMAPEQAAGRSDTDGRVDIYALGVIMYEMLVGRVPHKGDTMVRTLAMQMLDPVEPPSKLRPDLAIPPELEAVVLMTLAKKREQRYQTMGDLLAALEKVQRDVLPPPVAVSVTGSPVFALAPLPPGADAGIEPSLPPAPLDAASSGGGIAKHLAATSVPITGSPLNQRSKSPTNQPITTRPKNEPQFVTSEKPISFEHLTTDTYGDDMRRPPRRWPWLVLLALVLGGSAGAVMFVVANNQKHGAPSADAALAIVPPTADAMVAIAQLPDAGVELPPPSDANVIAPHVDATDLVILTDAYVRVVHHPVDAASGPVLVPDTATHRGTTQVEVLTKPETATVYVGTSYRGPNGTKLEEPLGTKLEVRCQQNGYKPGTVTIVFDGKTEVVLCVLQRIKTCVGTLKNPFDECPDAGSATP